VADQPIRPFAPPALRRPSSRAGAGGVGRRGGDRGPRRPRPGRPGGPGGGRPGRRGPAIPGGPGGPTPEQRRLLAIAGAVVALIVLVLLVRGCGGGDDEQAAGPARPADPPSTSEVGREALAALRPDPRKDAAALTRRAQAGFANPLYRLVPGGPLLTAARVSTYRKLIEDVAKKADEDPDLLEAIVYLESAGRPDAMASDNVESAAGFTQIVAETGTSLLGMKIDLKRSRTLTRRLANETRRRNRAKIASLRAARIRVDPRFDPRRALEATCRYLDIAREKLGGRDDLAVASYHMGIGNLQNALAAYGRGNVPYVELYFGTDPIRTPKASAVLAGFSDDSSSYLWRVGAAERIMAQFRRDPAALRRETELQTRKASSEDLLHPPNRTEVFERPEDLATAERDGTLRTLPTAALQANGLSISGAMGELAGRLDQPRSRYRALRPTALAGLVTIGAAVRALGGRDAARERLTVTSTVRDARYQSLLGRENVQATKALSQHTTGWALDISRDYRSDGQARRFQWVLTRMQALNLIAWVREPQAIHLTVSSAAERPLGPILRRALGSS